MCCWAKLLQLYLTLCDPMDYSLPGSSVHGILQQEYWSGLPCSPSGNLPDSGTEPASLMSLALAGRIFTTSASWQAPLLRVYNCFVFLMDWTFYHYKMFFFLSWNAFVLKSISSGTSLVTPAFFNYYFHGMSFCILLLICVFSFKWVSCRQLIIESLKQSILPISALIRVHLYLI